MTSALDGLTVLELGAGSMPASVTGMLLADNGARVTKVEPPEGDRMRALFPHRVPGVEPGQGELGRRPADNRGALESPSGLDPPTS